MKREFQKRVTAIVAATLFLMVMICQFGVPASAASEPGIVDYNTMVKTVQFDQVNKMVNITIPAEYYWLSIGYSTTYASADPNFVPYSTASGVASITASPTTGANLPTVQRAAFLTQFFMPKGPGKISVDNPALSLANIPDGSVFTFDYSVGLQFRYQNPLWKIRPVAYIVGSDGNRNSTEFTNTVSTRTSTTVPFTFDITSTFTYHKQPGDIGIAFDFMVIPASSAPLDASHTFMLSVNRCSVDMSLPRLYDLQEEQQITNGLLTALGEQNQTIIDQNDQLIIQNDKILYGEDLNDYDVTGPGGFNDTVNQQGDKVHNSMADINKMEKPDPNTAIPDIGSYVPVDGANMLSSIMGGITSYNMVSTYLLIVIGLFVVSFIMFGKKEN